MTLKHWFKHISCDCKYRFNSIQHVIQTKIGIIKYVNVNEKIILFSVEVIVEIIAYVFVRRVSISKILLMIHWSVVIYVCDIYKLYMLWMLFQQK